MPKFTYKPEGAEPLSWDVNFNKLMSPERIVIEKMTGMRWTEFQRAVFEDSTVAVHALLYVLLKRDAPTLKPEQVIFCEDDYDADLTDDEAREAHREILAIPEAERDEVAVAALEDLLERFPHLFGEDAEDPKAEE